MFCPNCGNNNLEEAVFCGNCGKRIVQETFAELPSEQAVERKPSGDPKRAEQIAYVYPHTVQPTLSVSKKPMFVRAKVLLIAITAMVIAAIEFLCIGLYATNPKRIAENYFKQFAQSNYEKAYTYLDVEDSPFMNKELFAQKSTGQNIENFRVYETEFYGNTDYRKLIKFYKAEYIYKDSDDIHSTLLTLMKQKKKTLLFFDSWKVSVPQIVSDYTILVQKGLTAYFDDVLLTDEYKLSADEVTFVLDENYTYYVPGDVFWGDHTIKAECNGIVDSVTTVSVTESNKSIIKSNQNNASTKAVEITKAIYDAAMAGKDFSTISTCFIADIQPEVSQQYANLCNTLSKDKTNFKFTKLEGKIVNYINLAVMVELDYTAEYSIVDHDLPTSNGNNTDLSSCSDTKNLIITMENGNWVLSDGEIFKLW